MHAVVVEGLNDRIQRIDEGQTELKLTVQNNHNEIVDSIKFMFTEFKKSLERDHGRIDAEIDELKIKQEKMNDIITNMRMKIYAFPIAAGTLAWAATLFSRFLN